VFWDAAAPNPTMPQGQPQNKLTQIQLKYLQDWILQGAQNN
jgi:hypothetical protein